MPLTKRKLNTALSPKIDKRLWQTTLKQPHPLKDMVLSAFVFTSGHLATWVACPCCRVNMLVTHPKPFIRVQLKQFTAELRRGREQFHFF